MTTNIPRRAIREICEAAIALRERGWSPSDRTTGVQTGGREACVEGFGFVTISAEWLLDLLGANDVPEKLRPNRIQRKRSRGWRMPPNTRYVGRSTIYGNSFEIGTQVTIRTPDGTHVSLGEVKSNADAVAYFRAYWLSLGQWGEGMAKQLRGLNLACWCPLDQPCHADVLLELANK